MDDLISRADAIEVADAVWSVTGDKNVAKVWDQLLDLPSAQPERKKGHWTEKEVMYIKDTKDAIDAWQSCKCSECGRYDTRPYMYFFVEPMFCSYCGAEMKGENE